MSMFNVTPAVTLISQKTTATCWLASCQMLYVWNNKKAVDVETLLKKASATDDDVDYDAWCTSGIGKTDLLPLAKTLGFKWGAGGEVDPVVLRDTLKVYGPLLAVGAWNGSSHVIVVTGFDADDDLHSMTIANPWPEPGTTTGAVQTRNLNWFNKGLGTWKGTNGQYMHW
jgi:Papain-like cysteine protease AvrRpt2